MASSVRALPWLRGDDCYRWSPWANVGSAKKSVIGVELSIEKLGSYRH